MCIWQVYEFQCGHIQRKALYVCGRAYMEDYGPERHPVCRRPEGAYFLDIRVWPELCTGCGGPPVPDTVIPEWLMEEFDLF